MNRLKELRISNGLKQVDVAKQLGVTQANLSGWENDKWQPDNESLKKLCDIYHCSLDYLLGRSDTQNAQLELNIPDDLKDIPVAFHEGLDGLSQEDIDDVRDFIEFVKNRKKK